ncbi:MAG TPA: translation initiation factor IF-2 [Methanospirillum sp.]|uniref:translation initiation factor IF-2 n=1 Tax=Methanospirillum sp. TaxID=45200 RepID=UPI0009D4F48F|nr:translation initiation factor IF-2 [Methanospirillum sp.]OQB37759.1 MAG: putative translation initiation factor IF-2 [Euryarchaeota archaeon ADurb.Bin165]HPY59751.1 translation initiation factor IF-2 [Methanospirillum sp.]
MGKKTAKKNKNVGNSPHIRTPIVCVLGHVDHGKTSLLDRIRGSSVVTGEAGAITQHIGATIVPIDSIVNMSGGMKNLNISIPGLLFIDTPGHHAFTTLRARGGALADMAIVVVDINQNFQPQTIEAIQILRNFKTPFVVAATKLDRIHGWRPTEKSPFLKSFATQNERVTLMVETKIYDIVAVLAEHGFSSERYDRVSDFSKNLAIVPVSAHTGEGISDLLMVLIGLAQRYMEEALALTVDGPGSGTVLEVKEEKGLGATIDVILFDGTIRVGDEIAVATTDGVQTTKVRSLLQPRPMQEILVEDRFSRVKEVIAAAGVKVSAPGLDQVIAGSPVRVTGDNPEEIKASIAREMTEINVTLSPEGLVIKADTIGALEALCKELSAHEIPVMKAEVGQVSRHDVIEAETIKNPLYRVLIAFNTPVLPDAQDLLKEPAYSEMIQFFSGNVIYHILEDYLEWRNNLKRIMDQKRFEKIIFPAKIVVLPGCVFRQNNPAVVGVRILSGTLRTGVNLIRRDGRKAGTLKTMQLRKENIQEAQAGDEVAISIEGATVGRQFDVEDELIVNIPEKHVKILETEMLSHLSEDSKEVLSEYINLYRRENPFWGK